MQSTQLAMTIFSKNPLPVDTHVIGMNMQESNSVMSNEQLKPEVTLFVGYLAEKRTGPVFADLSKSYCVGSV